MRECTNFHLFKQACQTWKHLLGPSYPELRGTSGIFNLVLYNPIEWELALEQKPACLRIPQRYIASKSLIRSPQCSMRLPAWNRKRK